jgi:hypothetical protein
MRSWRCSGRRVRTRTISSGRCAALAIRDWAAEQGRELQQAFEFYRSVSAAHYVREREALLAASA